MNVNANASPEAVPEPWLPADSGSVKYRLLAELGRGGMADVFLALMSGAAGFSKLVVIKRLDPVLARDAEFLQMFLDEARLAARLNHPNVVQTHEVGHAHDRYFIAMEYLDGQPLNRILRQEFQSGGIDLHAQLRILSDALSGLHYAHELRDFDGTPLEVVHRDVSPQNVFVTYEGQVKVVDFGVAKASVRTSSSRGGMIKGKVAYMAPEQARGGWVDRRADLFSMGIMLWEIAARRRIWKGLGVPQILRELMDGRIPRLGDFAPETPPALRAICARATAADPNERFWSAAEFRAELELLIEDLAPKSSALRDVGAQVRSMFAEQQAHVRSLIESQLGHLHLGADDTPTGSDRTLPRLDELEPPSSGPLTLRTGAGIVPPNADATAYSVHLSSIPPAELGADSLLRRRALAALAVTGALALIGVFSLILVMPTKGGSGPAAQPAAPSQLLTAPPRESDPRPVVTENTEPARTAAPARIRSRALEPTLAREPAPPPPQRVHPSRIPEERDFARGPGSRRRPRNLDKTDPWAE